MVHIRDVIKNKNTCIIAIIIFCDNKGIKPKQFYGVLSCVIYSLIKNYVCIDYLSFQSKTLSSISSNGIF